MVITLSATSAAAIAHGVGADDARLLESDAAWVGHPQIGARHRLKSE